MPSAEFFYLKDGRAADAELHEAILAEGDHAAAQEPVRRWLRGLGYSEGQINAFLGP
jgi:hypothetical protein